jgi:hypothetical protein
MTETKERACRAADKAKCRHHRYQAFAEDATQMYVESSYSKPSPNVTAYVQALAEKTFSVLNDRMQKENEEADLDDAPRFKSRVLKIMAEVSSEVEGSGNTRSHFSPARLADAAYYQFQRTAKSDRPKSEMNVLTSPDAKPFDRSAAAMIQKEGHLVTPFHDGYYGGREDHMATNHFRQCGSSFAGVPEEDEWDSFAGTFNDDPEAGIDHGMKADVECKCGAVKGEMRVMGNFSDLTRKLVNEYS